MPRHPVRRQARARSFVWTVTALAVVAAGGCRPKAPPPQQALDFTRELPPGEKALRKLPPSEYPDFSAMQTNGGDLARAIDNSLRYLTAPSSRAFFPYLDIPHDRAVATLLAMQRIMVARSGNPDWNAEVREKFEVYQSVGAPRPDNSGYSGQVLFTGYFTPIYDASFTRQGPYQWPLYRKPADLPAANDAAGASGGEGAVPYFTRAEIERTGRLAGQELVWLKSRWEAYVVTVQGSARLRLPDGRVIDVGYAGTNGHPYVSPGRQMVADGVIPRDQLSFTGLRRYFDAHPEAMDKYLWANPRTTFFTDATGQGIRGSLNVPVTPFATIATDKDVYPRAMPAFVVTRLPASASRFFPTIGASGDPPSIAFRGFMLDQDTGGAIRAAGRCDLYMGVGPEAEQIAGHQLYPGALYYLAIRPELVSQYVPPNQPPPAGPGGGAGGVP